MSHNTLCLNTVRDKYRNMSAPAKAGLWYTLSAFFLRGLGFITTPIYTRILTTDQFGVVSVFNTWEQLISIICTFNLFLGGFNNGMRDYKDKRYKYVSEVQGLITVITLFWLLVYLIGRGFWNRFLEMPTHLVLMMFLQILASAAFSLWSGRERFEFKYRALVAFTITNALLYFSVPIVAILLSDPEKGAEVRILTQGTSIVLLFGSLYIFNIYKGKSLFSKKIWKSAFLFNLPLVPHYLSTMVLSHSDRIMISKLVGNSEAGLYTVAYSGAMLLNILATSINQSFAPWIYGEIEKKRYKNISKVSNGLFLFIALVITLLMTFAPEFLYLFAGAKYSEAVIIVPSVASSLFFIFLYQIFANVEFYYEKNKFIAYASLTGALLNLVLNYYFIKLFGYIAAGYTTLICYIVFGVSHYLFVKIISKEKLDGYDLFDYKTIFLVGFCIVILSIVMVFLYHYFIIRYALIGIMIVMTVIFRKNIMQTLKVLKK